MEFLQDIFGIRVDMGGHFFSARVGQKFNRDSIQVTEIIYDHNDKIAHTYYIYAKKDNQRFRWQTFQNCKVNLIHNDQE